MDLQQLPLGLCLRDDATFANFYVGDNQQIVAAVLALVRSGSIQVDSVVYLWGATGSGRSHLLQASCHAAAEYNIAAFYLSLRDLDNASVDMLQGLENLDLVCIDDVNLIAGDSKWEEGLFHLFNRIRQAGHRLLISGDMPPAQLKIRLMDLKSRLGWGVVYHLHGLSDEQMLEALRMRAQGRGLELDGSVGRFMLRRCPRDMGRLFAMLEQLDQASLAEQRRLTIPFVKDVLGV